MKIWVFVWICLLAGKTGCSQELSLQEYRRRVLEYNQELKQSELAVEAALYALKGVKTGFFPQLDATGSYSYQFEKVEFMPGVDLKHDNYNAEASLVQNVYAGSAVRRQYEIARIRQAMAALGEEHTLNNIQYAADVNYWTVVANRDLYEIAVRFVEIVGELYEVVRKRFQEGAISRTDVLMVQARLKEAELQLTDSETNYKTALQAFNVLMGMPATAEIQLTDSIRSHIQLPLRQTLAMALTNRADYQISIRDVELARLETRLIKADYLPRLAVGVQEKWGTTLINVDGDKRFSTVAFANLNTLYLQYILSGT